jgi:hypothetical protein
VNRAIAEVLSTLNCRESFMFCVASFLHICDLNILLDGYGYNSESKASSIDKF